MRVAFVILLALLLMACSPVQAEQATLTSTLSISPLFPPSVQHWSEDIVRWAGSDIPPNFLATIMAVETCGDPNLTSDAAGAVGLFQIHPPSHPQYKNLWNVEENARAATSHIRNSCARRDGVNSLVYDHLTFACYNGGHYALLYPYHTWHPETRVYMRWATILWVAAEMEDYELYSQWWETKNQVCARSERKLKEQ